MGATGLAGDPVEYRTRLGDQDDAQIDAWAAEAMRDMAIRRGVLRVLADFRSAARIDDRATRAGVRGRWRSARDRRTDGQGQVMVPAITLHCLVAGIRRETPDGRNRLIDYLVENFHDFVYV